MRISPKSLSRNAFAASKGIILESQKKYYPLDSHLNDFKKFEKIGLSGWREFFYGDKSKARKYFLRLKLETLKKPKILIAIILTLFSEQVVNAFIMNSLRYRMLYYLKYFNISFKEARRVLKQSC